MVKRLGGKCVSSWRRKVARFGPLGEKGVVLSDSVLVGRVLLVATLFAATVANLIWAFLGWGPLTADYRVFWEAARLPVEQIYFAPKPFVYPPPAIPLFKTIALIQFWPGFVLWTVVSASAFYLAASRLTDRRIALLSMLSVASVQNLILGQTAMLLGAAILAAFTMPAIAGGVILGIVAVVKPQLLVMAPLALLVRRDWPMLQGAAVGSIGAIIASLALFGIQPWFDWVDGLPRFHQALIDMDVLLSAITPAAKAERLGLDPLVFLALGIFLATATVTLLARRLEGANLVALIVGTGTLAVPYALPHDIIALVPACIAYIIVRPGFKALPAMLVFGGAAIPAAIATVAAYKALIGRNFPSSNGRTTPSPSQF